MVDRSPFHVAKALDLKGGIDRIMFDEPLHATKGWWFATSRDGVGVIEKATKEEAADLDARYPHTGDSQVYVPDTRMS